MENTTKSNVDKYGFGKLDTWFIDKYLKHDNETLDEAKARIAAENEKKSAKISEKTSRKAKTQTKL